MMRKGFGCGWRKRRSRCSIGMEKVENGVTFVDGGYYISMRDYEMFPPSSSDAFKLSAKEL